jgi:opacity protein-like surface antigen
MVFSSANNLPAIRAKYTLDFLEIPIMVRATLGWGAVRPYLFAGPNFGIRLKASSDNTSAGGSQSYNVKDQIGSTNVSIEVGAGVGYKFAENTTLTGDARYSYGLVNLSRTDGDSWKTRDVRVMIGLLFRL